MPEPESQRGFIELATGKREDQGHDLFLRGLNSEAVQTKEEIHSLERDAFVSVNEGMVVGEAKAVSGSKGREIRIGIIVEPVSRALES